MLFLVCIINYQINLHAYGKKMLFYDETNGHLRCLITKFSLKQFSSLQMHVHHTVFETTITFETLKLYNTSQLKIQTKK